MLQENRIYCFERFIIAIVQRLFNFNYLTFPRKDHILEYKWFQKFFKKPQQYVYSVVDLILVLHLLLCLKLNHLHSCIKIII